MFTNLLISLSKQKPAKGYLTLVAQLVMIEIIILCLHEYKDLISFIISFVFNKKRTNAR